MVSVTVVVVDPAFEADAPVGFGAEAVLVEEFVGEGAVEALGFAVGLGPIRAGAQVRDAAPVELFGEEPRAEVGAVVGHDGVHRHAVGPEPVLGPGPEPGRGGGGLVIEGLDVVDPGVVADGDVQVGVPAAAAGAPGAAGLGLARPWIFQPPPGRVAVK